MRFLSTMYRRYVHFMTLKVIAYARNGHSDKFGVPRQSREESPILTRIVFEPGYAIPEALRGIDGFSHLWLLWGFSENQSPINWSPTVRPPRLGGNKRMGVFATRSPFRPNPIGLSSVRNLTPTLSSREGVYIGESGRMELIVSGADLVDGTPIYDIKPYLTYSDCHSDAQNGFAEETANYQLSVTYDQSPMTNHQSPMPHIPEDIRRDITYILSQDPRPGYQDDPDREYKMDYAGYTITFHVKEKTVIVKNIEKKLK